MSDRVCWLCGKQESPYNKLDRHHIFGGAYRKKSEKYGLVVDLCHDSCHIFGPAAVHNNKHTRLRLHKYGQIKAQVENHWTMYDFMREFGKNYL